MPVYPLIYDNTNIYKLKKTCVHDIYFVYFTLILYISDLFSSLENVKTNHFLDLLNNKKNSIYLLSR